MTIAAGFVARDGLLMCADMEWHSSMRVSQQKLFPSISGRDKLMLVFGLAGSEIYGKMAIQDCQRAVQSLPDDKRSLSHITDTIRATIKAVNEDYVDKRPEAESEESRFELVVGIRHWTEGIRLFRSKKTAFLEELRSHVCIGIGEHLAEYVIGDYDRGSSLSHAKLIALKMLRALKAYDTSCGGMSDVLLIRPNEFLPTPVAKLEVDIAESHIHRLEASSDLLLSIIANTSLSEVSFEERLSGICDFVRRLRSSWREELSHVQATQSRLIALAPDLLAALKAVIDEIDHSPRGVMPPETYALARAAIAKAEGNRDEKS